MDPVKVFRGKHRDREDLFGPLPGYRHENVVAYEFELPESFEPWPDRSRLERTFVLLDVGVSFANPCWKRWRRPDGSIGTSEPEGPDSWYVDLISVEGGVEIAEPPTDQPRGHRTVYFFDPEHNLLEIYAEI